MKKSYAVATQGILRNNRLLSAALGAQIRPMLERAWWQRANAEHFSPEAVLAWGQKKSAERAKRLADKLDLPLITVEDGFLRSLDSGTQSKYGASFVVDTQGVYFDLRTPNDLQALVYQTLVNWQAEHQKRAERLLDSIVKHRLSKYNAIIHAPDLNVLVNTFANERSSSQDNSLQGNFPQDNFPKAHTPNKDAAYHVLVIDQVAGDASITGAGASEQSFYQMLAAAMAAHPTAHIWIKAHPAGSAGALVAHGQLTHAAHEYLRSHVSDDAPARVRILADFANPLALMAQVNHIYTVSSHMGFEALLLGKTVHCFGVSWYSGFGLTDDDAIAQSALYQNVQAHHQILAKTFGLDNQAYAQASQNRTPSLAQLFYAAYVSYSHYANPATGKKCEIEDVVEYLRVNRAWQQKLYGDVLAFEFSRWKTGFVQGFAGFAFTNLMFKPKVVSRWEFVQKRDAKRMAKFIAQTSEQKYLVWGQKSKRTLQKVLANSAHSHAPIFCMEDGFIRSNGLGANLLAPLSVVLDDVGIYYDATKPSRLEEILQTITLDDAQNARAEKLRALMLAHRVSKYNVGARAVSWQAAGRTVRLVVGQVEDDASVQSCASLIRTNAALLARVRRDFPHDFIVYKPHPDVEAGLRRGKVDADTLALADVVAHDTPMPDCLAACDVVHTISSLTGFEALLRDVAVVCYGLPFYAGFGLTTDVADTDNPDKLAAQTRRARATPLTLNALIYGTLIEYALYHLPHGFGLATPEDVIDYLYLQAVREPEPSWATRQWRKAKSNFMRLRNFTKG
ncbi:Capsule polysaccharide biosynthesis protein [Moraxella caviae]|nr:capsular polysaccharide biosynthesis protein [Moraxella caviae]STZ10608.1 Capsule polysaccharide biosynthesis protein [Moraxella caviae]VEW13120.1 Capsule polysaccharide biosynthesis protein [Moraxella caviae]